MNTASLMNEDGYDPAEDELLRRAVVGNLAQDLRRARGWNPYANEEVLAVALTWETIFGAVPIEALESREPDSLFVEAVKHKYTDASDVWGLWDARTGHQLRIDQEVQNQRARVAQVQTTPEPKGHGRQSLLDYLAQRGIGEAQLSQMCR